MSPEACLNASSRFTDPASIWALLESRNYQGQHDSQIVLLSANWLRTQKPTKLPPRQELPPDAIIPVRSLRAIYATIDKGMAKGMSRPLPIIAVLHGGLRLDEAGGSHPDPAGEMLETIVKGLDARWSDATMSIALALWTLDFGALCWSYYIIRHNATPSEMQGNGEWTPFLRVPTLRSREDRAQDGDTAYRTIVRGFAAAFYTLYFFLGVLAVHTLLSHMYRNRNPYLAALLVLQCVFTIFASLDDLTHIGSPWGIQECSKIASVTLSIRGLYLVPLTVVWTGCAIAASFPPSYCREC